MPLPAGVSVTMPCGGKRPRAIARAPTTIVVARPPYAPNSHTPTFGEVLLFGFGANGGPGRIAERARGAKGSVRPPNPSRRMPVMDSGGLAGDNGIVTRRHTALLVLLLVAYGGVLWGGSAYFTRRAEKGDRELPVYVMGGERMAAGEEIFRF